MSAPESQKENHAESAEDIFAREQAVLTDARAILDRADAAPDELRGGMQAVTRSYDRLLRMTRRLTEMSDNSHRELMEITEFKNHLLGMAAHDIRTPLGVMIGFSQIMLEDADELPDEYGVYLNKIHGQGEKLLELLNDILALSESEAGSMQLNVASFSVAALLGELVELGQVSAQKKQIALEQSFAAVPQISGDRARLEQVFSNLISNAIKYSPAETRVDVQLALHETDWLRVSVRDQGPGIIAEEQQFVFRPFRKTSNKPTGGEKSTGLGLAIAERIVIAHGGRIQLESAPGAGCHFYVDLPLGESPTR